ncbi:MAG: membrane protein [Bacteroidetes bacterium]|nr:MAG: membrane protein [Bacteroidota bacterium]
MGKIKDQTIKGSIYSYLGVGLGFIISGLVLPKLLTTGENGLLNLLLAYSSLFAQFATLGFGNATGRLFSWFRDEKSNHHGFIGLILLVVLVGFLLSLSAFFILKPEIISKGIKSSSLFADYITFVIPLIFFNLLYLLLDVYFKMLYKTIVGTFLKEFLLRILILVALLLYFLEVLSFREFIIAYVVANSLPAVFLFIYLIYQDGLRWRPEWRFIDRNMAKSLINMSFYGIVVGFSSVMVLSIDRIMIDRMVGIEETGIYSITFFFGTLVVIPARSLRKIAGTMLAEAWKQNDMKVIREIYSKSIVNQLIIGVLIFVGVWSNIHNVFEILPQEYERGKWVIFFVALTGLIEMSSGVSEILIQTSRYYRFSAVLNTLFLIFVVAFNFLFISQYGLVGAAIANAVAFVLNNTIRYWFIYNKFGLKPFNLTHVFVLFIGLAVYAVIQLIPPFTHYILDIAIRSSLITLFFVSVVYIFKLSPDLNQSIQSVLRQLRLFIKV